MELAHGCSVLVAADYLGCVLVCTVDGADVSPLLQQLAGECWTFLGSGVRTAVVWIQGAVAPWAPGRPPILG